MTLEDRGDKCSCPLIRLIEIIRCQSDIGLLNNELFIYITLRNDIYVFNNFGYCVILYKRKENLHNATKVI